MGIADQIRGTFGLEGSPAGLLRSHPALIVPEGVSDEQVRALVYAWNPATQSDEHDSLKVAEAVWWHGPFRLDDKTMAKAHVPEGFAVGYAARCRRSRMWRSRLSRQMIGLSDDITRDYPAGVPAHAEGEAWDLVRALARVLGGVALLPGNPSYRPAPEDRPSIFLYSPQRLAPSELSKVLAPVVPDLRLDGDEHAETYLLVQRGGGYSVDVDVSNPEYDRPPYAARHLGEGVVAYDLTAPDPEPAGVALERAAARALHERIGGIVLDEYGLPVPDVLPGQPGAAASPGVG